MAYIKFSVEFFNEKGGTKFQTTGLALSEVDYPDDISKLTKDQANRFLMNWETALLALSRYQKDKLVSAGTLTRKEAFQVKAQQPLLMDSVLAEEAMDRK